MIWAILAFAFAALGSKVLLGLWCVWAVLPPSEQECSRCDRFTTQIEPRRGLGTLFRWCRIQQRWCPSCGEHFLARGKQPPLLWVGSPDDASAPGPTSRPQTRVRLSQ